MSIPSTKTTGIATLPKVTISIPILLLFFFAMLTTVVIAQPLATQQKPALQPGRAGNASQQMVDDFSATLKKYEKQIHFTENKGQWDTGVLFKADFIYGQAIAMPKGMMVSSFDPASVGARSNWVMEQEEAKHEHKPFNKPMPALKGHAWMMNFVGASPAMKIESKDAHGDLANYFLGSRQATDVRSFNEVWYNNVYDNIDVRYYPSAEGALEYDIIANPGSNPSKIAIKFDGIEKLELADGHLVLHTSVGKMDLPEPYAYQTINGKEIKVEATYALNANNELTFALGKYNTAYPLVIDPIAMRWATWMTQNSASDNHGHCIWVDGSGNIYVVSRFTGAGLIVTPGAFASAAIGDLDMNVGKYTEPTSVGGQGTRVWQTYLGGEEGDENPYVAEMGPDGNLYIAGYTTSDNFPLLGGSAFSGSSLDARSQSGDNCFVIKINPAGNSIKGAVIGGGGSDDIYDLRITSAGDIILGGLTTSTNLSSLYSGSGASNTNNGSNDFWMFKINQNLSSMTWMRNYGGSGSDQINILNIKSSTGDIYAGGSTSSTLTHAGTPRQGTKVGGTVGYLMRANSAGTLQWSSYFNSSGNNSSTVNTTILCMEMNVAQTAFYFGGMTAGLANSNISSSGVYDNSQNGNRDFYVAKMDLNQTFLGATYVGSTDDEDNMMGLNVDANDDVYIFGYTYADNSLFPTAGNPLQSANQGGTSGRDKVFFKLETDLSALLYSTYYGGSGDDSDPVGQRGIKFSNCRIYTIVTAESNNIPLTVGALNTTKASATSIYEPALIVWANPPDLGNNTITGSQYACNGTIPGGLTGSTPNYELPTITRNGTTSNHPSVGTASAYQWQWSTDQTNWANIPGATGINLTPAQIGTLTQTTYFRRIINGDACVLNNGNSQATIFIFRISGAVTNNTCFGGTSGAINVTASGNAPGNVTYSWSDGATTEDRTGLAAGTYTVTATATNGCQFSQTFTITQPTQIQFTATPSNATCGASNGSISVSGVSGGSGAGYTYSRDGVTYQGGNTFSGLAGGSYTIYVKDGSGCIRTQQVTVGSVNALVASVQSITNVSCASGANGSVTITQTGGSPNYQYQLGSGSFQSSATFNNLAAGTYTVTVRDANNCTASVNFTITQPNGPTLISPTNTICEGSSVTISANANGQNVSSYLWSNGATTPSITVNSPGVYWVTLSSADGCSSNTDTIVLNVKPSPNIELDSLVNVACAGDSSGSIDVNITTTIATCLAQPQTSPESCTACTSTASGNTNVIVNAGQKVCITGVFTGQLTINTGGKAVICSNISPQQVNVNGGELWITNSGVLNANNFSGAAGSIIRNYGSIITNNFTTNGRFYNFGVVSCVGGFQITSSTGVFVNDGNFTCTGNFINYGVGMSNNSMQVGSQFTNAPGSKFFNSCNLRIDSQFNINAPFYNYGHIFMDQSNTSATLASGVTMVLGQGSSMSCAQFNVNGTLAGPSAACAQIKVSNQSRFNNGSVASGYIQWADLDGNIETNNGSYGPNVQFTNTVTCTTIPDVYTYSWTGPNGFASNSQDISNLPVGTYTITVTNSFGCSSSFTFTITGPASPLSGSLVSTTNAACNGSNGSLTVSAQGGTPAYSYSIDGQNFQASGIFNGLAGGAYTITVKDSAGCIAIVRATVGNNAPPVAAIQSQSNILCYGDATGSVTIAAQGGTPAYQYQVGNGAFATSNVLGGLVAGSYIITVKDVNGCTDTVHVTITQPSAPLSVSVSNQKDVDCFGNASGAVTLVAQGGTAGYTYSIDGVNFQTSPVFNGLALGQYGFVAKDANGCLAFIGAFINQPAAPLTVSISGFDNVCHTFTNGSATAVATGGTTDYTYTWNTVPSQSGATATGLGVGTYTVNVVDANGCRTSTTVTISNNPKPQAGSDFNICEKVAQLPAAGQGESWALASGPANASVNNAGAVSGMNAGGTYMFILTNQHGCSDTALVVTTANCPLIANPDNASTNEDQAVTINVPSNDVDPDGNIDNSSVVVVTPPANGNVVVNNDGSITYTPNANYNGPDSFIYNICDTGMPVYCDTALVTINVIPVNDPPVANLDTVSTPEDTPVVIDVPSNDTDPDGNLDSTSVTVVTPPNHGSTTVDSTGNIIYTPDPNYNGPDTLVYQICDTGMPVLCDTALVIINVTPVNDPPIAVVDTAYTNEDVVIDINVDINDYDIDGNLDTNTVVIIVPPVNGNASYVDSTGIIHNVPAPNFCGIDSLQYAISDSLGLSDSAWVYIYVRCVPDLTVDPNVFPSGTNISCYGANDGSIDLTIDSGTPPYTISWTGPNGYTSSNEDISGLAPGTYTVIVIDGNNNGDTATVTLTEPTQLASSIVAQTYNGGANISCAGACDGSVNLTVSGGSAPYLYSWTGPNGFTSQQEDISAICGGTYYVTITDLNGCTLNDTIILSQPDSIEAIAAAATYIGGANVSCQNACDGSIDLSVNGGSQPYSYVWSGPNGFASQSEDLSGLCAGTYSVVVTDANGCSTSYSITLTPPTVVDGSITPVAYAGGVNVSCAGACDGAVNLAVSGGAAPYSFAWTGPNGFASQSEDLSGLCAGTYFVTITDLNGCTATESVTLTAPTPVNASAVAAVFNGGVNVSCAGACDGAINLTPSGGIAPYTFIWSGPNGFASQSEDLSGLCAGTYNVVVTDANGCTSTTTVTLTPPAPLSLATIVPIFTGEVNVSCANACDGAVNLTVSGGVGPFSYSWVGPNGFAAQTEDINNICIGTYTVTVTDANGCSSSTSVTLVGPTPVSAVAVAATYAGGVNVSCAGACDGSINLTPSGGISLYTFSWVGPNGFVSQLEDLSGLCVGTYTVTVTDLNGCTATTSVTLTPPTQVGVVAVAATFEGGVNISCANACDGSINLTPSSGVAPYSYSWVGPNGFASQLEDISGLCAGTYTVIVTDANGCTASTSVTLTAPTPLSGSAVAATFNGGYNVSCSGACDGSVNLTVTGGTAPYTYSWVGAGYASQAEDAQGLCSGSYTVTITDANGCTTTLTIDISSPQPVSGQSSFTVDQCGQGNGSATIAAAGGDGNYSYAWADGAGAPVGGNSATISGLAGGSYTVTITDGNNCTASVTIEVPTTEPVQANGTVTNVSCNSACNGAIDIELLSGTFPFTYTWSGPNGYSSSLESITGICPGNYTVAISDSNNCAASYNFTVIEPTAIAISVSSNSDATCQAANGSATVAVVGGTGSYDYLWTGGATTPSINNVTSGSYTVQVTDDNGCVASLEVNIGSQSSLALSTAVTNVSCNGLSNGAIDLTVSGAVNPTFAWTVPATTEDVDSLAPGTYVVFVTDDNGCEGWDTVTVTQPDAIIIVAADIVTYPNGYNVSGVLAEDGSIDISVEGGSAPYAYLWNPSGNADAEDQFDMAADTYTVVITDANGCVLTEEYILEGPPLVELPTGFSPDGDGKNDYYVIHGIEKLLDNQFTVFNRWGQVVFDKKGYQNDWAGTNYDGSPMPDGTYFILFTVNIPGMGEQTYKVTVELRANFSSK